MKKDKIINAFIIILEIIILCGITMYIDTNTIEGFIKNHVAYVYIDIVTTDNSNNIIFGECKYTKKPLDINVYQVLQNGTDA